MFRLTASALALAVLLTACGSSTASPTGAPTAQPTGGVPTPGTAPTGGGPTFPIPSFQIPSFQIPSFAPDPVIEAEFPTQIDGQPVTDITSAGFLAVLQGFGMPEAQLQGFITAMQSIGVDPATVGFGTGTATVGDESVTLQVVRFPGGNAGTALELLVAIDQPDDPPTLTTASIGGKNVTVATDSDGDVEFFYVNGEWAWFLDNVEEDIAATVFAALP